MILFKKHHIDHLWRVLKNQLDLKPTTYKDQIFIQMNDSEVFLHRVAKIINEGIIILKHHQFITLIN